MRRTPWPALLALLALTGTAPAAPGPPAGSALILRIDGAIGPATAHYVVRGIESARTGSTRLIILTLDTPGGLDASMRDIIRAILASEVPVAAYVTPSGARAASAGTYILYASSIAAMAPATNLGAATPVAVGGQGGREGGERAGEAAPPATAMERKVVNDAAAYIRGLAELHGRNAEWAEAAVRGAASLPASVALAQKVIDVIAADVPDLLRQIDGREVRAGGRRVQLHTKDLRPQTLEPDWRTRLLAVITHPSIAYGLLLIGIYGLLLEGYHPGVVLPGVVGTIALLLALFAFQLLSVSYAGLALVVIGAGMIVAEFFVPAYGSLGLGGLTAFVFGSLILFDTDVPGYAIGRPLIGGLAAGAALLLIGMLFLITRARRRPVVTGAQAMIGAETEAAEAFTARGRVRYGGELWNARSSAPLAAGQPARIVRVQGLTLYVEPL